MADLIRIMTIDHRHCGGPVATRQVLLRRLLLLVAVTIVLTACGFDPTSPEYDQRRYTELQRADCREVASLGAKPFISGKSGETYESVLERCQRMQAMSFEQYQAAADRARASGVWTFDEFDETTSAEDQKL